MAINEVTGEPLNYVEEEPCRAPLRIFFWPDNRAHTYQCLYCGQGFGV